MCLQGVAVYEYLRQGRPDAALCQLVQNLKSKEQTASGHDADSVHKVWFKSKGALGQDRSKHDDWCSFLKK